MDVSIDVEKTVVGTPEVGQPYHHKGSDKIWMRIDMEQGRKIVWALKYGNYFPTVCLNDFENADSFSYTSVGDPTVELLKPKNNGQIFEPK